jgi:non-ribosomal peptide synthetase component F/acyl carrier protein
MHADRDTAPPTGAADSPPSVPGRPALCLELTRIWSEVLELPVDQVRTDDDFFEIGGHSLLATRLQVRIRRAFGVTLPLREVLDHPTVDAMTDRLLAVAADPVPEPPMAGAVRAEGSALHLSTDQERIWLAQRVMPDSPVYNVPIVVCSRERLDAAALAAAFGEVVRRNEILRTVYSMQGERPVQRVLPPAPVPVPVVDLRGMPDADAAGELDRLTHNAAILPFDLERGPVLRGTLFRSGSGDALLIVVHHIATDARAMDVLSEEISRAYAAASDGRLFDRTEPRAQYADYVVWQQERLGGEDYHTGLAYWTTRLAGAAPPELPSGHPLHRARTYRGTTVRAELPTGATEKVRRLARRHRATTFMVLLAGAKAVLWRYSGNTDITLGTLASNRRRPEFEDLIGFFVNTIVLRTGLAGDLSFDELVGRVRTTCLEAYQHQEVPFEHIVERLNPPRVPGRIPLAPIAFSWLAGSMAPLSLGGAPAEVTEHRTGAAKFDLAIFLTDRGPTFDLLIEYNSDLYDEEFVQRFAASYVTLVEAAVADPAGLLATLPVVPEDDHRRLLREFNGTVDLGGAADPCVHHLVERQVLRTPDAPAVEFGDETMSYRELDERANRLAHHLRDLGVDVDGRVAICAERSPLLAVGLLAIFKSGGCYVPLDRGYPAERLAVMLADSATTVLLTERNLADRTPPANARVVLLDDDAVVGDPATPPDVPAMPDSAAYVMYTSGSTGVPLGVVVPHRCLTNLLRWRNAASVLGPGERTLQLAPPIFDLSFHEIFTTLTSGGTVVMVPPEARRAPAGEWLERPPIGRPVANARAYVLGDGLVLMPIGVPGELYLGGVCVPRGYIGRPDLTAERFVPDPFTAEPGARMYRTGDLCQWSSDGRLLYLGRVDHQVKVDRRALPAPTTDARAADDAPASELEREIARVWREVLGLDRIGVTDSFFELGGNSLLIMRLQTRLRKELNSRLAVVDLFAHHTVAAQAEAMSRPAPEPAIAAEPAVEAIARAAGRARLAERRAAARTGSSEPRAD